MVIVSGPCAQGNHRGVNVVKIITTGLGGGGVMQLNVE